MIPLVSGKSSFGLVLNGLQNAYKRIGLSKYCLLSRRISAGEELHMMRIALEYSFASYCATILHIPILVLLSNSALSRNHCQGIRLPLHISSANLHISSLTLMIIANTNGKCLASSWIAVMGTCCVSNL